MSAFCRDTHRDLHHDTLDMREAEIQALRADRRSLITELERKEMAIENLRERIEELLNGD